MKFNNFKYPYFIVLITLTIFANYSYAQKGFIELPNTFDSTFGYTANNPIKLKKGNQTKSIHNSNKFLLGLRTIDNQKLNLLYKASIEKPLTNKFSNKINDRHTGLPINNKLQILDKYIFLTSNTNDTITLFIDIYSRGNLFLPIGLKYDKD